MSIIYRIRCFCVTYVSINIFTIPNWGFGISLFNFYFHLYGVSVDSFLSQRCAMVHYPFFDQPRTKFIKTRAVCDRNIRLRDLRQMISRFDKMKRRQKKIFDNDTWEPKDKAPNELLVIMGISNDPRCWSSIASADMAQYTLPKNEMILKSILLTQLMNWRTEGRMGSDIL